MRATLVRSAAVLLATGVIACSPTPRAAEPPAPGVGQQALAPSAPKTVTMVVRYEVTDLAAKRLAGAPSDSTKRAFNATLALIDGSGAVRPYVAESLPQLNTDSWKLLPDGKMETTYRLKPNLTWHDGQPLTADDFVFAYRVYTAPGLGAFTSRPQDQMEEVIAQDPRTLVIRWRSLYGDAGSLVNQDLDPLPQHILDAPLAAYQQDPSTMDTFLGNSFWTLQYVGLGPYKLERWEPGTLIEGSAFDGHALGRPKIDRFISRPVPDENTAMTNLLGGSADIGLDNALRFEHAVELQRQWGSTGGVALMDAGTRHWIFIQFRPEILKTTALTDVRVRRALAHAIDREPINQALFDGQGFMSEQWIPPKAPYYNDAERAVTRYPYDPRRAEQLMTEAGLTKDSSGFFATGPGDRFKPGFLIDGSPLFEREANIIQDSWARIGIDMDPKILSAVESRQNSSRTTFPDMYASSTSIRESGLDIFSTAQIASANRNWAGNNRGGWSNPDYERLWSAYSTTLDRSERNQQIVEMMKVVNDQLPGLMLYFNIRPTAHVAALKGPEIGTPETLFIWNVHEWEMK